MVTAVVIGANGAIGNALLMQLLTSKKYQNVIGISRKELSIKHSKLHTFYVADYIESEIEQCCQQIHERFSSIQLLICCIGMLHSKERGIFPEKSTEQLDSQQLSSYFNSNTIAPALWLKCFTRCLQKNITTQLVFLSARIGSISDNELGGWYGYRASKAALNMIIQSAQVEFNRRFGSVSCISYHPGTVNSNLSLPFKSNIPKEKLFTAKFTATQLLNILATLPTQSAAHFIDWDGKNIPW